MRARVAASLQLVALTALVAPVVGRAQDASTYTVAKGDTLASIAKRNGLTPEELAARNPQFRDPNAIFPGDYVNIAPIPTEVAPAEAPVKTPPPPRVVPLPKTPVAPRHAPTRKSSTPAQSKASVVVDQTAPTTTPTTTPTTPTNGSDIGEKAIEAEKSGTLRNPNMPDDPTNFGKWCRALVREAFKKATGRNVPELSAGGSAWDSYLAFKAEGLIQTGGTPPKGAIVFWSPAERGRLAPGSPGAKSGHIAISNGDGTVASNIRRGSTNDMKDGKEDGIGLNEPIGTIGNPAGWVLIQK
jgi:LysM repeat protein